MQRASNVPPAWLDCLVTVGSFLGFEAEHEVATIARDTYIHGLLIVFSSRRGVYRRWCGRIEASSPCRLVFLHAYIVAAVCIRACYLALSAVSLGSSYPCCSAFNQLAFLLGLQSCKPTIPCCLLTCPQGCVDRYRQRWGVSSEDSVRVVDQFSGPTTPTERVLQLSVSWTLRREMATSRVL